VIALIQSHNHKSKQLHNGGMEMIFWKLMS